MIRRLIITGLVQNVGYRHWFAEQMVQLGVCGWVRNRVDRSVEAVVEGSAELIDAAIARARQGSPASQVDDVAVQDDAPAETFNGFEKRATQ